MHANRTENYTFSTKLTLMGQGQHILRVKQGTAMEGSNGNCRNFDNCSSVISRSTNNSPISIRRVTQKIQISIAGKTEHSVCARMEFCVHKTFGWPTGTDVETHRLHHACGAHNFASTHTHTGLHRPEQMRHQKFTGQSGVGSVKTRCQGKVKSLSQQLSMCQSFRLLMQPAAAAVLASPTISYELYHHHGFLRCHFRCTGDKHNILGTLNRQNEPMHKPELKLK